MLVRGTPAPQMPKPMSPDTALPNPLLPLPPPRPIRLLLHGQPREISGVPPTRSLLDWLREDVGDTGCKEGCNEGDCGACTVLVGELDDQAPDGLRLRPLNACLLMLPTLDGKAVFTVEDLTSFGLPEGATPRLHPVQQALVECHGSQCGFCTPGFAMALTALQASSARQTTPPNRRQIADALAGNLCRCTGYRPILDAAEQALATDPPRRLDTAPVVAALQGLQAMNVTFNPRAPFVYEGPEAGAPTEHFQSFIAPTRLEDFAQLRAALPLARLLAGNTDIGLWVNKQFRELGTLLSINQVTELNRIETLGDQLSIGAAVRLEEAWAALADHWPPLREAWLRFASPPVRQAGTLGGNIANGSPIGDGAPVLIALGARLRLRLGETVRELALEDFYLGYMKNALQPGEFVERLILPLPSAAPGQHLRAWKVSKRYDSDISSVFGAFRLELDGNGRIQDLRLVWGGLAATVRHAPLAEATLRGQPWDEAHLQAATAALAQDFQPLTDLRASAAYRLRIAGGLLRRLWLETRPEDPLPPAQTSVWAERLAESKGVVA